MPPLPPGDQAPARDGAASPPPRWRPPVWKAAGFFLKLWRFGPWVALVGTALLLVLHFVLWGSGPRPSSPEPPPSGLSSAPPPSPSLADLLERAREAGEEACRLQALGEERRRTAPSDAPGPARRGDRTLPDIPPRPSSPSSPGGSSPPPPPGTRQEPQETPIPLSPPPPPGEEGEAAPGPPGACQGGECGSFLGEPLDARWGALGFPPPRRAGLLVSFDLGEEERLLLGLEELALRRQEVQALRAALPLLERRGLKRWGGTVGFLSGIRLPDGDPWVGVGYAWGFRLGRRQQSRGNE